jgi:hypothetical protein
VAANRKASGGIADRRDGPGVDIDEGNVVSDALQERASGAADGARAPDQDSIRQDRLLSFAGNVRAR